MVGYFKDSYPLSYTLNKLINMSCYEILDFSSIQLISSQVKSKELLKAAGLVRPPRARKIVVDRRGSFKRPNLLVATIWLFMNYRRQIDKGRIATQKNCLPQIKSCERRTRRLLPGTSSQLLLVKYSHWITLCFR